MIRQTRSELTKLATTPTVPAVEAALFVLVTVATILHAFGLSLGQLDSADHQRSIMIDVGVNLGGLFAALLGALAITSEVRTGTIRPTLLVTPNRYTVMAAKSVAAALAGALTGVVGTTTAAGVGTIAFGSRTGLSVQVEGSDIARLIAAGAGLGALLSLLGLAVGTLIRSQVPTLVGIFAWLLFIENLLMDAPGAHRFVPGALAQALAGQNRDGILTSGWVAAGVLTVYAAAAIAFGTLATARRDFA
jgi:ABC-2 type transport system permease protein